MRLIIISLLFSTISFSAAIDLFSDQPRLFKPLLADPREAQVRIGYLYQGDKKSFEDVAMGGQLNVLNAIFENGHSLNIAVKGLISSRFQLASKSFDLYNTDYIGGLSTVFGRQTSHLELFISHQSSHFGDDVLSQNLVSAKNLSLETVRLLFSREFSSSLRVYGGPSMIVRSDPEELLKKFHMTIGAEYPFLSDFFVATNIKFKQEHEYSPDGTLVLGYFLGDASKVIRRQRLFLELYNGYSPMGQYDSQREFSLLFGLGFTL